MSPNGSGAFAVPFTAGYARHPMDQDAWIKLANQIGPAFAKGAAERDAADAFVGEHYAVLRSKGVIAAQVPTDLGGGGATHSTMGEMLRIFAHHDPSTALALSMHQHLVSAQVFNHAHGRPAPVLPRVAKENLVLVSTGARDWLDSNGTVRPTNEGFRVSAKKAFASGSPQGDILVTSAPYEDPDAGWQVLHFAVSMKADGVSIGDDWKVHGMRATGSQTVTLDDVLVPEATVVLRRPRGPFHEVFNLVVGAALPLISAVYLGVAESAAEIATKIAKSNAAANDVQWAMGEMRSSLVLTQTLYAQMMRLVNDLDFVPSLAISDEILILKSAAVDAARITVERAMEAVGGRGFYRATGLEQLLRDVRAFHYHPMPAKQQVRFTGRLALGLDPID